MEKIIKALMEKGLDIFLFHFTDNQGMEMEGPVEYKDRIYNVQISALCENSYYRQIAEQIMKQNALA